MPQTTITFGAVFAAAAGDRPVKDKKEEGAAKKNQNLRSSEMVL
jgi:hypothetical protein